MSGSAARPSPASILPRLSAFVGRTADPLARVHLAQERLYLETHRAVGDNQVDLEALGAEFIATAVGVASRPTRPHRSGELR